MGLQVMWVALFRSVGRGRARFVSACLGEALSAAVLLCLVFLPA